MAPLLRSGRHHPHPYRRRSGDVLTPREQSIIMLLSQGKCSKEIAVRFNTSTKTVETQRTSLIKKLGTSTTIEAVLKAIREGWIDCPCSAARDYFGA